MRTEIPSDGPSAASPSTLGSRIAAARRQAGLTQEQLGRGLGSDGTDLGKGAISAWEVDRNQPSALQLAAVAERLKVSAEYLLRGREWNGVERRKAAKVA